MLICMNEPQKHYASLKVVEPKAHQFFGGASNCGTVLSQMFMRLQ